MPVAESAGDDADPLVRVLQPPLLLLHGGRNEDNGGAPRRDLCVLDLISMRWTRPNLTGFASAAGAYCQSPDGLTAYIFGGQNKNSEITASLLRMDLRAGVAAASSSSSSSAGASSETPQQPGPMDASTFKWEALTVAQKLAPRFASAAACTSLAAPAEGASPSSSFHAVHVFGGMTVEEDLADFVTLLVPA